MQTPTRRVRSRFYFTSESHIYSIVNTLRYWCDEVRGVARVVGVQGMHP